MTDRQARRGQVLVEHHRHLRRRPGWGFGLAERGGRKDAAILPGERQIGMGRGVPGMDLNGALEVGNRQLQIVIVHLPSVIASQEIGFMSRRVDGLRGRQPRALLSGYSGPDLVGQGARQFTLQLQQV